MKINDRYSNQSTIAHETNVLWHRKPSPCNGLPRPNKSLFSPTPFGIWNRKPTKFWTMKNFQISINHPDSLNNRKAIGHKFESEIVSLLVVNPPPTPPHHGKRTFNAERIIIIMDCTSSVEACFFYSDLLLLNDTL